MYVSETDTLETPQLVSTLYVLTGSLVCSKVCIVLFILSRYALEREIAENSNEQCGYSIMF